MLLGVVADDFTGAGDIANTLARGGMATTQFLGVPASPTASTCEAGVVALKSRSIASDEAIAQSLRALEWLLAQGARQIVFKYCSTFDSTAAGNIGPVGEALARRLGVSGVVACPAFPATDRTVYQGHLFVGDRLLSESSLRHHPLNPMTDPDLRRWLRLQTHDPVGLVSLAVVSQGAQAIGDALRACAHRGERLVIVDAVCDADLIAIGAACADAPLLTGGSGIALGLPANFARLSLLQHAEERRQHVHGRAAILAGSCSVRTLEQIRNYLQRHPGIAVDPDSVLDRRMSPDDIVRFANRHSDDTVIAYSSANPADVAAVQQRRGASLVAHALERFFSDTAQALIASGVRRLIVAGGETSGAVVSALGFDALDIGPEISPGVPVLYAGAMVLALKSGNFGDADFFERALRLMEQEDS
jgi:3-dehydrotetronate 4-kinase